MRRGYGRNNALGRMLSAQSAATPEMMNARRVQFPARMGLERVSSRFCYMFQVFNEIKDSETVHFSVSVSTDVLFSMLVH